VRVHIRRLSHASLLALVASLVALGPARALPPGNVLSNQKLSDTAGNFTPVLDNLDEFGQSVAWLGDLDGAGPAVSALAVGVAFDDDGGLDRGAVYINFLAANGTVLSSTKISDTVNFPGFPLDDGDWFGQSVAFLGDLDGAGPSVAAIAVGAPGDDDGGLNFGAVYILYLSENGTVLTVQKISNTANLPGAPLHSLDAFGESVANLGDLDGAGASARAIAVGSIGDDAGGTDRGAVYILYLSAAGAVSTVQKISNTANFPGSPLHDGDNFGGSVASLGDLDGAGPSVLALAAGAQLDDDGGVDRGAVYILFLNASGVVSSVQKISDLAGGFTGTFADGDEFGNALTNLGDIDGAAGGVTALAIGDAANDDGGLDKGAVQILFLNSNGTCNSFQKISSLAGNFLTPLDLEDGFGTSVAFLGDLDGAGASKLAMAVGTAGDDDGGEDRGAVYILFLDGIAVTRTLTTSVVGTGTISKNPDLASYADGASVQLTANPGAGWAFSAWSGSVVSTSNPVTVVMDANKSVTATFVDVAAPTATVTSPNGGEALTSGTSVNITWTAADNAAVTTVDLELSRTGAAGPYQSIATGIANSGTFSWLVTLPATTQALVRVTAHDAAGHATQDVSNAVFSIAAPIQRTLTLSLIGGGTVTKSPNQATYDDGSTVQLTANPGTGWAFSAWSGGLVSTSNPASVVMNANKSVTATFLDVAPPTMTLTSPNGGEVLGDGLHFKIHWTATDNGAVRNVDFELSRTGAGGPWQAVATGASNNGTFDWVVTLPATSHALIRATAHDTTGHSAQDVSNAEFSITGGVGVGDDVPTAFALSPLSPNPVRAGARFQLALPSAAHVRLSVYDLQGRERVVLADDLFPAGRHSMDGAAITGAGLDSGLYFLRMTAPGTSLVQRFLVTR